MDTNRIITTPNEVSPCHYTVNISVPEEEVRSTISNLERKFLHQARIPGFRVGKTPPSLIKKRFFNKIRDEAKNELIKVGLETAIRRCDPEPVTFPTFVDEDRVELKDNSQFDFTVEFDVAPKIDLPEYKGIKLACAEVSVKEEDINKVVGDLLNQRASYEKVDRSSDENDMLMVSYETEGVNIEEAPESAHPLLHNDETWLLLSEPEIIPGIIDGLKGVVAGDTASLKVTFPDDSEESFLASKSVEYTFTIHEVHGRKIPEVDDEFAKLYGVENVDELRSSIEKKLKVELEFEKNANLRRQIFDFLQESTDFSLPPKILEAEEQYAYRTTIQEWAKMGKSLQVEEDKDEFDRLVKDKARKRLKLRYIVSAIAKNENIEVVNEEVDNHFETIYSRLRGEFRHDHNQAKKDFLKSNIKWNLLMDKVGDRLLEFADIRPSEKNIQEK